MPAEFVAPLTFISVFAVAGLTRNLREKDSETSLE
jgi:hypothetical protein